jgi:hypothetical protein
MALALARSAGADEPSPTDKNLAQSLFDAGRHLMDSGQYAEACSRFEGSERLDPGGGTLLNLALCYDKLGKLAHAYRAYNDAISSAIAEHRSEREAFARQRVAALAPRLPHLTLDVTHAPGLEVKLDGAVVPESAWGTAAVVDPGLHMVEASAPGSVSFQTSITSKEGEERSLAVALVPASPPAPVPAVEPAPAPVPPAPPPVTYVIRPPPPVHPVDRERSPAFYVLGSVGIASLVASAVTGGIAWSAHESVAQKCSESTGFCADPSGISDASRARTFAWVSTATLGVGVVGVVVALVLPMKTRLTVGTSAGGAGIAIAGSLP